MKKRDEVALRKMYNKRIGQMAYDYPDYVRDLKQKMERQKNKLTDLNLTNEERGYAIGVYDTLNSLVSQLETCKNENK